MQFPREFHFEWFSMGQDDGNVSVFQWKFQNHIRHYYKCYCYNFFLVIFLPTLHFYNFFFLEYKSLLHFLWTWFIMQNNDMRWINDPTYEINVTNGKLYTFKSPPFSRWCQEYWIVLFLSSSSVRNVICWCCLLRYMYVVMISIEFKCQ